MLSLLVLLRNEAVRGIEGSKLEWVRARVEEQCKLLEDGLPLTFPLDALLVSPPPPTPDTHTHSLPLSAGLMLDLLPFRPPSCLTSFGLCCLHFFVR